MTADGTDMDGDVHAAHSGAHRNARWWMLAFAAIAAVAGSLGIHVLTISHIVIYGTRLCGWPAAIRCEESPVLLWLLPIVPIVAIAATSVIGLVRFLLLAPNRWSLLVVVAWPAVFLSTQAELGLRVMDTTRLITACVLVLGGLGAAVHTVSGWMPDWKRWLWAAYGMSVVAAVVLTAALPSLVNGAA